MLIVLKNKKTSFEKTKWKKTAGYRTRIARYNDELLELYERSEIVQSWLRWMGIL